MRLGIMQPYFFPGPGYFHLIARTDRWVVFDTAQYRRHSWINRNRILHPTRGWQYILAPLEKHARETSIDQIRLVRGADWREKIVRQLEHYRKGAPFYEPTVTLVREALDVDTDSLARLDVAILARCCQALGIRFSPEWLSELDLELDAVEGPGDWALRISEALGADTYVNPPGGRGLFDPSAFAASGIELVIQDFPDMVYATPGYASEPGLSIIDALMWNSVDAIRAHLDNAG